MILRTGASRDRAGFTLVEVLTAVTILSFGLVGVIRAYITLANGIETSAFTVQASYLLKSKMADIEKEAIENPGVTAGTRSGNFGEEYPGFRWEYTASDVLTGTIDNSKAQAVNTASAGAAASVTSSAPVKDTEVVLSKIQLFVMRGNVSGHGQGSSLWTYLENHSERQ